MSADDEGAISSALLLLVDSRIPTGGYAHSGGMEAAVGEGRVRGAVRPSPLPRGTAQHDGAVRRGARGRDVQRSCRCGDTVRGGRGALPFAGVARGESGRKLRGSCERRDRCGPSAISTASLWRCPPTARCGRSRLDASHRGDGPRSVPGRARRRAGLDLRAGVGGGPPSWARPLPGRGAVGRSRSSGRRDSPRRRAPCHRGGIGGGHCRPRRRPCRRSRRKQREHWEVRLFVS